MTWAPMPEVGERQSGSSIEYMKAKLPLPVATLKYQPSMNLPLVPSQWYPLCGVSALLEKGGKQEGARGARQRELP